MHSRDRLTVKLLKDLASTIEQRKELQRLEASIKQSLRTQMGKESILEAGRFCLMIEQRRRTHFDNDAIMHDYGRDFFTKYLRFTDYEILRIQPIRLKAIHMKNSHVHI